AVIAGYQHKIIFLELGVSNQKGLLDFYQDVDAPALSSFKPQLSDRKFKPLKIITVTLDDIVSYPVDFIKLDIEGAEFDALRGSIVGIGNGAFSNILTKSGRFDKVVGIDIKKNSKLIIPEENYSFYEMSVVNLKFSDNQFDTVVAMEVLEH
ncbi:FkbM family methyltransferase, partial [Arthrospira platensis SPKY2]